MCSLYKMTFHSEKASAKTYCVPDFHVKCGIKEPEPSPCLRSQPKGRHKHASSQ